MSNTADGLETFMKSPFVILSFNLMAALIGAIVVTLVMKTMARTVPGFAYMKAGREIGRAMLLAERLRERDPTRMLIALIVQQFSIYIVLSLLAMAAIVACLATRGAHFDGWFPFSIAAIAILFQKTHEHFTRASELLQMKHPGAGPVEARVRVFFLAMTPGQIEAMEDQLVGLRQAFAMLPHAGALPPAAQPA